jgi:hypothetical protein
VRPPAILAIALVSCRAGGGAETFAPASASAVEPVSPPLSLQWTVTRDDSEHPASSVSRTDAHGSLTLHLVAGGRARFEEDGTTSHFSALRQPRESTRRTTTWRTVWLGTWASKDGGLSVELERTERTCETNVTDHLDRRYQQPCPEMSARFALGCRGDRIAVPSADGGEAPREIWFCLPKGPAHPSEAPFPWVFGKEGCIETRHTESTLRRVPCEKPGGGAPGP